MKVSVNEKKFFEVFTQRGHEKQSLINFILGARRAPMYGSIFHINGIGQKLKNELSKIYHGKIDFEINGIDARTFISKTWDL